MSVTGSYLPAAGRVPLDGLYDPVMSFTMRERTFRNALIDQATRDSSSGTAIDLGTGTGSLAIALARSAPEMKVIGVDPDPGVLRRAQAKSDPGLSIQWVESDALELPFDDHSVELICSSLMIHHLQPDQKPLALAECLRVLTPGGGLHIADWGRPQDPLMSLAFFAVRMLDGFSRTAEHAAGEIAQLISKVGFIEVQVTQRFRTCWGSLELIRARAPYDAGLHSGS